MTGKAGARRSEPQGPDRWVLITGCGSGIGRALVQPCRDAGWGVVATARQLADLETLPNGNDLYRKALDLTRPATLADTVAGCSDLRLVAVINNAGYGQVGPLELLRPEELRAQFETNVVGLQSVTNAFLPLIRKNARKGEGRILQVASMLGRLSIPLAGPYNASKHAVVALAETLRLEVGREVHIVLVEPGAVKTRFRENLSRHWGDLPERVKGTRYERTLKGYMERREELGEAHGLDPEACAARIVQALNARRPPRRVVIGRDAFWAGKLKALLPAWAWEWMLRRTYRIR
ncbi:MAG: SDR family oxidoreductase [Acidobacteria bacterium]|nr:SDR family oxidoreductase [Acidobacteriota bacterium]